MITFTFTLFHQFSFHFICFLFTSFTSLFILFVLSCFHLFYFTGGGDAPKWMASLNSAGAPWAALLAQGSWSLVLLMLPGSSFASLLDYFGPASWCFYALSSSALIRLRIREPDAHRPYKVPFYPLPPLIVIGIAIMVVCSSLLKEPLYCSLALSFVALSVPVHHIIRKYFPDERNMSVDELSFLG